jgi:hypothetical protein
MAKVPNQGASEPPAQPQPVDTGVGLQAPLDPRVLAMMEAARNSGAAPGEDFVPEISAGRDATPFPNIEPNYPFVLVFDPNRWDVLTGRVVPILYRLGYTPGANGVDRGEDNLPAPAMALAAVENKGHKVIPFRVSGPSYMRRVQVGTARVRKTGQIVPVYNHHTRWDRLFPGSSETVCDTDGYSAWLAELVERGVLQPPPLYVLENLASRLTARLGHYRGKAGGNHPLVARYESDLAAVQAFRAKLFKQVAPAPAEEVTA